MGEFGEGNRPGMYGPPPYDHHRRNVLLAAGLAVLLVIIAATGLLPSPDTKTLPPESTATAELALAPDITASVSNVDPSTTPNTPRPAQPTPVPTATDAPFDCPRECLVRVPESDANIEAMRKLEIGVTLSSGGQLWAAMKPDVASTLRDGGVPVAFVTKSVDTLPLYVVRVPDGLGADAVREFGEILDVVDNQYLVSVPGAPPYIASLADTGISVEKFPPLPAAGSTKDKPALGDGWGPAGQISADEIQTTITDLQAMGVSDALGSRHYTMPGNVEAAEYLFDRLAEYGLKVWYEDFIADNGTLALNVVGEIHGRDASEVYLLSAHFDSIAADTGDPSLAPGGLDNGTGVATLLEVARVLSGYELAHPVHIAFFNAEEVGLQGARAFAARAVQEGRPYAGAYNVDSVGALYETNRLIVNADENAGWLQDIVVTVNDINSGLEVDVWPRANPIIIADDEMLSQAGIPTILLAAVMYGDPMINQSGDTIAQVDVFRVQRVAQLVVLSLSELVR